MSSTLTINGVTYTELTAAFAGGVTVPIAGNYYAVNPFGSPPLETAFTYDDKFIPYVGVFDAIGRKRVAPKGKIITAEMIVINATKAGCMSTAAGQMETMNQLARYAISLPNGNTRNNCVALDLAESKCLECGSMFGIMIKGTFIQLKKD